MKTTDYRWIMYMHHPMGNFDVIRVVSLTQARTELWRYGRATYTYEDATASLYPYSEEAWAEAESFRDTGNPFDYPSKVIERGPKGGMRIINA